MKATLEIPTKERPSSQRTMSKTLNTAITTPVLTGFYYAIEDADGHGFSIIQVVALSNANLLMRLKLRQFAPSFKALPDFLIPEQLGDSVAQFWLPLDDFISWRPLLMQRGVVDRELAN